MGYQRSVAALALLAVLFTACRKEEEDVPPTITLVRPSDGFAFTVPDTLEVELDAYSEGPLDRVLISLLNAQGVPVVPVLSLAPTGNPAHIEVPLPVTSEALASGTYRLVAEARSGEASARAEADVQITAAPLRLRHVIVLTRPAPDQMGIQRIDSLGELQAVSTVLADLNGADVSSAAGAFFTIGPYTGPLTAYAADGGATRWARPNGSNAGIPWFTSLDVCADGLLHVGTTDGLLRAYTPANGAVAAIATLANGYRSGRCAVVGDRLLIAQNATAGGQHLLRVCASPGGAYITDHALDLEVVRIDGRTNTQALLFGNRNGQGIVQERSIAGGGGWEPRTWSSPISAAERVDANTWIVALEDGRIERFTYTNAGSLNIGAGAPVRDLGLDPVSGVMFAVRGQEAIAFDPGNGAVAASWALGAEGAWVLPVLNR